jgi:hypothetical protein
MEVEPKASTRGAESIVRSAQRSRAYMRLFSGRSDRSDAMCRAFCGVARQDSTRARLSPTSSLSGQLRTSFWFDLGAGIESPAPLKTWILRVHPTFRRR